MPKQKDLKRLIRSRARKTGESYTTARSHILQKKKKDAAPSPSATGPSVEQYAKLAGMSDAAVKAKTGCTWEKWVWALDRVNATEMPHRDIARHVREKYHVDGWWAQTVTVGYERIRGLRDVGQRRGGTYDANKSKTVHVPLPRLYRAFSDKRQRSKWLPGVDLTIRASRRYRSMRMAWHDGSTVSLWFTAKGDAKSQVALQHSKLADKRAVERVKQFWTERFAALTQLLGPRPTPTR